MEAEKCCNVTEKFALHSGGPASEVHILNIGRFGSEGVRPSIEGAFGIVATGPNVPLKSRRRNHTGSLISQVGYEEYGQELEFQAVKKETLQNKS